MGSSLQRLTEAGTGGYYTEPGESMDHGSHIHASGGFGSVLDKHTSNIVSSRIQEVTIEHPILRSVICPATDMLARSKCLHLLASCLDAAAVDLRNTNDHNDHKVNRDLVEFWRMRRAQEHTPANVSSGSDRRGSPFTGYDVSVDAMISKLNSYFCILKGLGSSEDCVVGRVFWEYWDQVIPNLYDLFSPQALANAHEGRMFRLSGDAAALLGDGLHHQSKKRPEIDELSSSSSVFSGTPQTTSGVDLTYTIEPHRVNWSMMNEIPTPGSHTSPETPLEFNIDSIMDFNKDPRV